jgi:hypothetical protein
MKTIAIAALLSIFVATPAMAARSQRSYDSYDSYDSSRMSRANKMYIGVSGGQHSTDITNLSASSTQTTSTAYSVFAGYSFSEFVAAELAYSNFGAIDLVTPTTTMKGTAGSASLVASLPMGKAASLFVKGGYASTTTEVTASGVVAPTDTLGAPTYGAGIQFNAGNRVGIRIGYDTYRMLVGTTHYNSNVASLGLLFKF